MTQLKEVVRSLLRRVGENTYARTLLLSLARSGLLPKSIWQRLPVERTFLVPLQGKQSFKYSTIANDRIGRGLFWQGVDAWEPETIPVFYKLAQKSNLFLDIGANTGLFTLLALAANTNSKVISFEPVPHVYERLVANVKMNGWSERCQPHNQAVLNTVGETRLHVPFGDVPLSASLHPQGFRGYKGVLIDIPVTTIDAVCSKNKHIDLIKIDVEGLEDKVLEGMQQILSDSAPTIIIECNPDSPFLAVESVLAKFGYHFFHLRAEGAVAINKIVPDEKGLYRNFLCTVHDNWEELN